MSNASTNKVHEILQQNMYCVVSSVQDDGTPWASPVFFGFDTDNKIYWRSWVDSNHSRNLRARPKAFVCVFDSRQPWGKGEGLYLQGTVRQIEGKAEAEYALTIIDSRSPQPKQVQEFLAPNPRRIYEFTPKKAWINSDSSINGQFIDTRKEAAL